VSKKQLPPRPGIQIPEPQQAKKGSTVKVHYSLKLDNGEVVEATHGAPPLKITLGSSGLMPDLENAIAGMKSGESKIIKIPAERAYGNRDEKKILELSRERLPESCDPQIGQHIRMYRPDGKSFIITVVGLTDSGYRIDANHPLAGKDLIFNLQLLEILNSS
jgi:peptidylprolyl isomerase